MNKLTVLVIAACNLSLSLVRAGDLNAPGAKPVTVQTEIERGYEAAEHCEYAAGFPRYERELMAVEASNKERNTDSPGFLLGFNLGAWLKIWLMVSGGYYKGNDFKGAVVLAGSHYDRFKQEQRVLDLTEQQVLQCSVVSYRGHEDDEKWAAITESRRFVGSH